MAAVRQTDASLEAAGGRGRPTDRTAGPADAARAEQTIRLLWRHREPQPRRRGPRPRHDLDAVVATAVAMADRAGLDAVTVRQLADRLGIARMAVYTYVSDLDQLVELMTDTVVAELFDGRIRAHPYGPRSRPPVDRRRGWRRVARTVATANLELFQRHPWLIDRPNVRPVLGPHSTAKYDAELTCFEGLGLTEAEMDLALWQLLNHVRGTAGDLIAAGRHAELTAVWWERVATAIGDRITAAEFPRAVRVGAAVGEQQGSAYDPPASYRFGLDLLLDGLQVAIDRRS